jgi:hypothetical protein
MTSVGFEPKIPASERTKTVHALERSTTVTSNRYLISYKFVRSLFNDALSTMILWNIEWQADLIECDRKLK